MDNLEKPWSLNAVDLIKDFNSTDSGLSENDAKERLLKYGSNSFHKK